MEIAMQLVNRIQGAAADLLLWKQSTEMCSREAHEFMNALMFGWLVLLIFSVWLYHRINHPKSKKNAHHAPVGSDKKAPELTANSL